MEWKFIYKFIPVPIFYVESLGQFAGKSNGFFVRIVKKYKEDKGLIEHELNHCRQFYMTLGLHGILYNVVKPYRYWAELQCYRIQLKFCSNYEKGIKRFANFLATRYSLNIDQAKIEEDLRK